ncbi:putative membrane protein [Anaplasma phagocytophilum str. ApNP]|uniref:Putative membrane protein n=1 Tax=Anaplasma phagocytophilum str. ApNP TaxID=1359153 RepID=A0A0F3NFW0_ANAPH|nr:putative membrane protein [Anaplasma phagocytophilum str. ApNP]
MSGQYGYYFFNFGDLVWLNNFLFYMHAPALVVWYGFSIKGR